MRIRIKGAVVRTDSWGGYDELTKLGYAHEPMVQGRDGAKIDAHLPMIHIAFSNLRTWLMRAHYGVSKQSGSQEFFAPSPHTTHRAGPQWAVHTTTRG